MLAQLQLKSNKNGNANRNQSSSFLFSIRSQGLFYGNGGECLKFLCGRTSAISLMPRMTTQQLLKEYQQPNVSLILQPSGVKNTARGVGSQRISGCISHILQCCTFQCWSNHRMRRCHVQRQISELAVVADSGSQLTLSVHWLHTGASSVDSEGPGQISSDLTTQASRNMIG